MNYAFWTMLHPSDLLYTLIWTTRHPSELRCILKLGCGLAWTTLHPKTRLHPNDAAPFWATLQHPKWATQHYLTWRLLLTTALRHFPRTRSHLPRQSNISQSACWVQETNLPGLGCTLKLGCTLIWTTLRPSELLCILKLGWTLVWTTLHPSELRCILTELCFTLVWTTLFELRFTLLIYSTPWYELRCTHQSYAAP